MYNEIVIKIRKGDKEGEKRKEMSWRKEIQRGKENRDQEVRQKAEKVEKQEKGAIAERGRKVTRSKHTYIEKIVWYCYLKPDIYRCIRSSRDGSVLMQRVWLFFGTVWWHDLFFSTTFISKRKALKVCRDKVDNTHYTVCLPQLGEQQHKLFPAKNPRIYCRF